MVVSPDGNHVILNKKTLNNMKKFNPTAALKILATAIAALGFIAIPVVQAADRQTAVEVQTEHEALSTEVTETFVGGYTVPDQYRTRFTEVPEVE